MADVSSAGWHKDPGGRHEYRYWDGHLWTEHVSDGGMTSTEAPGLAKMDPTAPPPRPDAPDGSNSRLLVKLVVVFLISSFVLAPGALLIGMALDNLILIFISVGASALVVPVLITVAVIAIRRSSRQAR